MPSSRMRDRTPQPWVTTFESTSTYDYGVGVTASGTIIPGGGPYGVVVPVGATLEVKFSVPLADMPNLTGIQGRIMINGVARRGFYVSNSGSTAFAVPLDLTADAPGTGNLMTYSVEAWKNGSANPALRVLGLDGVRIRHRIVS